MLQVQRGSKLDVDAFTCLKAQPMNREVRMNNITFHLRIIECPGTLPRNAGGNVVFVNTAVEPETKRYSWLQAALSTCEALATSADACLQDEDVTGARRSFAQAEAAFAEAREHLQQVDCPQHIERSLNCLGSKLDDLWVRLMSAARSPLLSGT